MHDTLSESLQKLQNDKRRFFRLTTFLLVFSVIVSLWVFWVLRRPGITLVGDADCRIEEHTHSEECMIKTLVCSEESTDQEHIHDETCYINEQLCEKPEHVHTIGCYSDENADVESRLDWQEMFDGFVAGDLP